MDRRFLGMTGCALVGLAHLCIAAQAQVSQVQVKAIDHVTPGGIPFRHVHMPRSINQAIQFGWQDGYSFSLKGGQSIGSWGAGTIMQGPAGSTRAEFSEDAKDTQASMNLQSGFRTTLGSIWAPPDKLEDAIALFSRTLMAPALDAERLKERIASRKAAIRQARVKAESLANDIGTYLLLAPGPIRQWRLGDDAMLDMVTVPRIEEWRKAVLTRHGLKIAAAGPDPVEKVALQIDKLLGSLPPKGADPSVIDFPVLHSSKTVAQLAQVPQTYLVVGGWSGFSRTEDPMLTEILTKILRERLFKAVRERLGAAYGAQVLLASLGPSALFFSASASVEHDKAVDALSAMRTELAGFLADGITAVEFDPQKEKLLSENRQSMRRAPHVARLVRNAMLDGLPVDHFETAERRLSALTLEDANRAIREKLRGRPLATIIVAPDISRFQVDCVVKIASEADACR